MGLPLPKGLEIARDLEGERELLAKARAYLEEGGAKREGIHASDIMNPRMALFKRMTGDGLPDRLVNMFVVGQLAHAIIEVIDAGHGDYRTKGSDSGTRLYKELRYSPDILDHKGGPAEIKTTRSFYEPKDTYLPNDDTYHAYIEQLMIYMAAEDKVEGRLILLYLNMKVNGRTEPQFYIWTIKTTSQALAAYRLVIERRMAALTQAIETKDHTNLPLCRPFMCKDCVYWERCRPQGRYEHGQKAEKKWTA